MKYTFTEAELAYLSAVTAALITAGDKHQFVHYMRVNLPKLKYKFTPNARYVNLKTEERKLLSEMVLFRHNDLKAKPGVSEEQHVVLSLMRKFTHGNSETHSRDAQA